MEKTLKTNHLRLYSYDDIIGDIIFPEERIFSVGEIVAVDFTDPLIVFEVAEIFLWFGPVYCFRVDYLADHYGNPMACYQMEMNDLADSIYGPCYLMQNMDGSFEILITYK